MNLTDNHALIDRLTQGNRQYRNTLDKALLEQTAEHGQHPYAIIICCSDSRVIPEQIFHVGIGDLFVIRVAGNVLDRHQLGSIEYAAAHLGCQFIVLLGHTKCGAVSAALSGHSEGFISYIVDDILDAVGDERDADSACRKNVLHGVSRIKTDLSEHPEIKDLQVFGAIYDIKTGMVEWL